MIHVHRGVPVEPIDDLVDGVDRYHALWAHDREVGEGRVRGIRRRGHRSARPGPRDARVSLRRLREDRSPPAHDPLRHPRGRDRPDPAGRRPGRPLPGGSPGSARLGRLLFDQADRTVLPGPARGPDHPRRVQRRRVRTLARRPRPAAPDRPGRLQPRRLRVDPWSARLAREASLGGGAPLPRDLRSTADRDRSPDRGPGGRIRGDARPDRGTHRGRPRSTRRRAPRTRPGDGSSPRSSTGTAATAARPGGTTSACASCRSTTSSESRSRSAASPSIGSSARRSSRTSCG